MDAGDDVTGCQWYYRLQEISKFCVTRCPVMVSRCCTQRVTLMTPSHKHTIELSTLTSEIQSKTRLLAATNVLQKFKKKKMFQNCISVLNVSLLSLGVNGPLWNQLPQIHNTGAIQIWSRRDHQSKFTSEIHSISTLVPISSHVTSEFPSDGQRHRRKLVSVGTSVDTALWR